MQKPIIGIGVIGCVILWLTFNHFTAQATRFSNEAFSPRRAIPAELAEQIARDHLNTHASQYGVTPADLTHLTIDINFADEDSGNRYVKFNQTVDGIEIYNAMLNVTLRADGSILYVGNRAVADIEGRINSRVPQLRPAEAIAVAADHLGLTYEATTLGNGLAFGTVDQQVRFEGGDLSYEVIPVRLMYQLMEDGALRLVWNLDIFQRDGQHWWEVRVDAMTGAILDQSDRVISDEWGAPNTDTDKAEPEIVAQPSNSRTAPPFAGRIVASYLPNAVGTYRVYQMPIESPSHSTPPAPADGRTLVANPDNATASPFGWHDTNGVAGAEFTITQGNNAYAYTDVDANNLPDPNSSPDGGAGLLFDAPLDLTLPPSDYRPAAVINLFYWANIIHDVSYIHGFTESARNFQENNYGNGGLGGDSISMEAQDGSSTNNARYFHAPDGTNPSVEMFLWTPPTPDRDGDLDNGIILHEYGHGISLRLTGNGVSCLTNVEQMGEGWSDFQSVMLTQKASDTATMPRGLGTYVIGQPPTGNGVRPGPYTTDMSINGYTYGDLPTLSGGSPLGFLWNTMLWDLNWKLIGVHGFNPNLYGDWTTGGNNLTYRLVHDGMKIQPCTPGFVDGRDSILAADVGLTGGDNTCLIWEVFARRGLGFSASQGSPNSTSDGTEAFDLPPECIAGATPTPTQTVRPSPTTLATSTATFTPLPSTTPTVTYTSTAAPTATATTTALPSHTPTVSATSTVIPPSPSATMTTTPTSTPPDTVHHLHLPLIQKEAPQS